MSEFFKWVRERITWKLPDEVPEPAKKQRVPWHLRPEEEPPSFDINERRAAYRKNDIPTGSTIDGATIDPDQSPNPLNRSSTNRRERLQQETQRQQAATGGTDFASAGKAPPLPPSPPSKQYGAWDPKPFKTRVIIRFKPDPTNQAKIDVMYRLVGNPALLEGMMRKVVAEIYIRRVIRDFSANIEKSLQMQTTIQNGRPVRFSPQYRFQDMKNKERLSQALMQYNEAQMDGNVATAERLQQRIERISRVIERSLQYRPPGRKKGAQNKKKNWIDPHELSKVRGVGQFRASLYALMRMLTDVMAASTITTNNSVGVYIGNLSLLNRIETPSATYALTGRPTTSKYKTFWRHVEFGTGVYRKDSPLNPVSSPKAEWWYGPRKVGNRNRGIMAKGTHPMNFLTDKSGEIRASDREALATAIIAELDRLFSPQ